LRMANDMGRELADGFAVEMRDQENESEVDKALRISNAFKRVVILVTRNGFEAITRVVAVVRGGEHRVEEAVLSSYCLGKLLQLGENISEENIRVCHCDITQGCNFECVQVQIRVEDLRLVVLGVGQAI